jgi:nitroreductase
MNKEQKLIFDNIITRRSIRDYQIKKVPEKYMKIILKAGDFAPSAGNLKSRKFVVIKERNKIEFVFKYIFSKRTREHRKLFVNASILVLMCADVAKCKEKYARGRLYATQDATLAGQNMMLMAHALDIGSCWMGQIRERKIKSEFRVDDGLEIVGIIAFGYSMR